nr:hypothetical protein [Nakamurella antarctica]
MSVDGALGVELRGGFGADGEVANEYVDLGVLEGLDNVDGFGVRFGDRLAVVLAEAIEGVTALDDNAGGRHVGKLDRVVLAGQDRLGEVEADLLGVNVECGNELQIRDVVIAELDMHQAGDLGAGGGVAVVLDALDERGGAVSDADNGDANGVVTHGRAPLYMGYSWMLRAVS